MDTCLRRHSRTLALPSVARAPRIESDTERDRRRALIWRNPAGSTPHSCDHLRVTDKPEDAPGIGPGVLGYSIAIFASLFTFAVWIAVADHQNRFGVGLDSYLSDVWAVVVLGLIPAAILGATGALFVDWIAGSWRRQWPSVILAGFAGGCAAFLLTRDSLLLLPLSGSTAIGRLAIVPYVWRRRACQRQTP